MMTKSALCFGKCRSWMEQYQASSNQFFEIRKKKRMQQDGDRVGTQTKIKSWDPFLTNTAWKEDIYRS